MSKSIADEIKQTKPFQSPQEEFLLTLMRTSSKLKHYIETSLNFKNISMQQYNVLRILNGAKKAIPIMEISARLVVPNPGVTRLITKLINQGYVKRVQSNEDKRIFYAEITDEGKSFLSTQSDRVSAINKSLLNNMSQDQIRDLIDLLNLARASVTTEEF